MVAHGITRQILKYRCHLGKLTVTRGRIVTHLNAKSHWHFYAGHIVKASTKTHDIVHGHAHIDTYACSTQVHTNIQMLEIFLKIILQEILLRGLRSQLNLLTLLGHFRLLGLHGQHGDYHQQK